MTKGWLAIVDGKIGVFADTGQSEVVDVAKGCSLVVVPSLAFGLATSYTAGSVAPSLD